MTSNATPVKGNDPSHWAIRARGVGKYFGPVHALRGVTLEVRRGSTFGLIGPNGAGKTTFIKVLLGICRADSGEIRLLGGTPEDVSCRRRVGYLPENLQLPAVLTPVAFLRSIARIKGLSAGRSRPEVAAQLEASLRRVGLDEGAWGRRMGGFSKGMRQRTGLAGALLGQPDLLVLDEPTDGIDPTGRAAIREVIRQEAQRGATILLNSHLLAETERLCDQVAIMAGGQIVRAGDLAGLRAGDHYRLEVLDTPSSRAAFARRGWPVHLLGDDRIGHELDVAGPVELSQELASLLQEQVTISQVRRDIRSLEEIFAEAVEGTP